MIYNYSGFLQSRYQIPEFFHYRCSYQQRNHRNLCILLGFRILIGTGDGFYRSMYNTNLQHAPVYNGIYFLDSTQLVKELILLLTHPIINRQCSWVKRLLWYAILVSFHFPSGFSIKWKQKKIKNICVPSLFWQAMQISCADGRNIFINMVKSGIWNLKSGFWKSCNRRERSQ